MRARAEETRAPRREMETMARAQETRISSPLPWREYFTPYLTRIRTNCGSLVAASAVPHLSDRPDTLLVESWTSGRERPELSTVSRPGMLILLASNAAAAVQAAAFQAYRSNVERCNDSSSLQRCAEAVTAVTRWLPVWMRGAV